MRTLPVNLTVRHSKVRRSSIICGAISNSDCYTVILLCYLSPQIGGNYSEAEQSLPQLGPNDRGGSAPPPWFALHEALAQLPGRVVRAGWGAGAEEFTKILRGSGGVQ